MLLFLLPLLKILMYAWLVGVLLHAFMTVCCWEEHVEVAEASGFNPSSLALLCTFGWPLLSFGRLLGGGK